MDELAQLVDRLDELLGRVDEAEEPLRSTVYELLDAVDLLHRSAIRELVTALGPEAARRLAAGHPAIEWLFEAYVPDERALAESALDAVRPFLHSHGGDVQVRDAADGIVRVRLEGACDGCSASAATLQHGVEEALRDGFPGFRALEVEPSDAASHPPPGAPLTPAGRDLPMFPGG
ncbi:MAG: NifU family protein [Actinobacteria bacterium]|nr:NifU family protein [Actinomycetota bacterium]